MSMILAVMAEGPLHFLLPTLQHANSTNNCILRRRRIEMILSQLPIFLTISINGRVISLLCEERIP